MNKSADLEATSKTCTKCREVKALKHFGLFALGGDKRRHSWCVECRRAHSNFKAAEQRVRTKAVRDAYFAERNRKLRAQLCSTPPPLPRRSPN
jgi:hypothetical protein